MIIENKIKLSLWIAGISLFLSILAVAFSIIRIEPFAITEATYIGIIVSSMGIIFAIFVGYQIYNVIEVKTELQKLTRLENSINQLSDSQKIVEAYNFNSRGCFAITIEQYENAILFFLDSLKIFLLSDSLLVHLSSIEGIVGNIEHCLFKIKKTDAVLMNDDIRSIIMEIKNIPNYSHLNKNIKDALQKI
jgi:hypothetical protein